MECEAVVVVLWEYLDEELGPEEADAVSAHLRSCSRCRPGYCWDRALLQLLARQRALSASPLLLASVRARLRAL
jgi:predicted anti-sigma-YlaC factor YlaD